MHAWKGREGGREKGGRGGGINAIDKVRTWARSERGREAREGGRGCGPNTPTHKLPLLLLLTTTHKQPMITGQRRDRGDHRLPQKPCTAAPAWRQPHRWRAARGGARNRQDAAGKGHRCRVGRQDVHLLRCVLLCLFCLMLDSFAFLILVVGVGCFQDTVRLALRIQLLADTLRAVPSPFPSKSKTFPAKNPLPYRCCFDCYTHASIPPSTHPPITPQARTFTMCTLASALAASARRSTCCATLLPLCCLSMSLMRWVLLEVLLLLGTRARVSSTRCWCRCVCVRVFVWLMNGVCLSGGLAE